MSKYTFTTIVQNSQQLIEKNYPFNTAQSILKNLSINHISSAGKCGGKAICGQCRIQITTGNKTCNPPNAEEKNHFTEQELQKGWRLACQTYCLRDICFCIPAKSLP